jgi:hypothetical protein
MVRLVVIVPFQAAVAGNAVRSAHRDASGDSTRFKFDALPPQLAAVPVHGSIFDPPSPQLPVVFRGSSADELTLCRSGLFVFNFEILRTNQPCGPSTPDR